MSERDQHCQGAPASTSDHKQLALDAARTVRAHTPKGNTNLRHREVPIAFIYLRVSTKRQARTGGGAEGYSIPAQRIACHAKAAELGATIHEEYLDGGESAKSADRDDLQRMLADVKTVRPDFVIEYKIDRLARNREDDIAINLLLRKYGVKLVSCMENIDDTPSGKLLYGLMAEIAQFYSGNLAQEVLKGMVRKAEEGGTPFRAPLGYLNRRETRGGVEFSWIELDPERAEIVQWCLEQYATGDWSAIDLTLAANAKGLTSRPSPNSPARPIGPTTMYHILQNPYYMGLVPYRGIHYEGKHEALIEPDTWLAIQHILAAHNHTGEKDRKHTHYLRSTIYCSSCDGRLVYSENTGNGGTYVYFLCVKKKTKTNNCRRPAVRVERIEQGIADFYGRFQVTPEYAEEIRQGVRQEVAARRLEASHGLERAAKRKTQLTDERQKLLQAHYAGAVPQDLLGSEMQRLTRQLAEADGEIKAAKTATEGVEVTLERALTTASHCEQAYLSAPDQVKRQINQGFFEKLYIGEDGSVVRAELTEPFRAMLAAGTAIQFPAADAAVLPSQATVNRGDLMTAADLASDRTRPSNVLLTTFDEYTVVTERENNVTQGDVVFIADGVNKTYLVGAVGIEPTTARV
ncbi:recombinase family protein [Amycolatopsis sp. cg5]|uniref:recombinase family protein n=1 Tax=Amycolatopsis sp. cg5 TaxID=3238802 RepID=UPI0035231D9D